MYGMKKEAGHLTTHLSERARMFKIFSKSLEI
jgi:hypothetical protein